MASVPEFLECPLCCEVFTQVVESPCCHKCFCYKCISDWISRSQNCPDCRKSLSSVEKLIPNIPFQRLVDELPAICDNSSLGCKDRITRGILQEHLKKCGFMMVKCQWGGEQCPELLRKDYDLHKKDCTYRSVACKQCTMEVIFYQLEKHIDIECPNTIIKCTHPDCNMTSIRSGLNHHLTKECPFTLLSCPFAKFGIFKEMVDSSWKIRSALYRECSTTHFMGARRE